MTDQAKNIISIVVLGQDYKISCDPSENDQVIESAKIGADVVTLPANILKQLIHHPLTDNGLKAFLEDWKMTGQSIT